MITDAAGGRHEVLIDGDIEMVVPIGEPGSLSQEVERIIDRPKLARYLAA